ncbi:MAG: hypothetical protein AAFU38_20255, partial [Bacteroidota bacterium]
AGCDVLHPVDRATVVFVVAVGLERVILKITAPRMQGYGTLVQLERVIAYDPIKADRDHENYCGPVDGVQDVTACLNGYAS